MEKEQILHLINDLQAQINTLRGELSTKVDKGTIDATEIKLTNVENLCGETSKGGIASQVITSYGEELGKPINFTPSLKISDEGTTFLTND